MADFTSLLSGMSNRDIGYVIHNIIQKSINSELTTADINEIDEKTPVLISNSKDVALLNDISIQTTIPVDNTVIPKISEDVDGRDLRLWLKFENAGKLRDYSLTNNQAFSLGASNLPGLFQRPNENHILKTDIFSYFNGVNQYTYVTDNERIRVKETFVANKDANFFIRILPVSLSRVLGTDANSWFTKVDDDQIRYGYAVNVDVNGNMHFYIRNNYVQYYAFIKDVYSYILTDPIYSQSGGFDASNFRDRNFITKFKFICDLIDSSESFDDWHFQYNPTTHRIMIYRANAEYGTNLMFDTNTISETPLLSYPIQDGKHKHDGTIQTTIHDNTGNARHGTLDNTVIGGQWDFDNSYTFNGGNEVGSGKPSSSIILPAIPAMQTLTEFSVVFWYNPLDSITNTYNYNQLIFYNGIASTNVYSIVRNRNSNDLNFVIEDDTGVNNTLIFPNAFPTEDRWYFVCAKWKSGEPMKLYVNDEFVQSIDPLTTTITSTRIPRIGNNTFSPKMKLGLFKFYNIQISQSTQDSLYDQGFHIPLFPTSESIQPEPQETPNPIQIPFSTAYILDKVTTPKATNYKKINATSGNNPYQVVFDVPDGEDTTVPEVEVYNVEGGVPTGSPDDSVYDIPDGVSSTAGVGSLSWSMEGDPSTYEIFGNAGVTTASVSLPSTDNSAGIFGSASSDRAAGGFRIKSTTSGMGQTLNGRIIKSVKFWLRGVSNPTGTIYCRIWNASNAVVRTINSVSASTLGTDWQEVEFTDELNNVMMAVNYTVGIEWSTTDSSDKVHIQRKGSNADSSVIQHGRDNSGGWSENPDYDIKTTVTYATVSTNPEFTIVTEAISSTTGTADKGGVKLNNQPIKSATLYLKRVGGATGTAYARVWNSAGTAVVQLGSVDVSTISDAAFQAVTFINNANTVNLGLGSRIGVEYVTTNNDHQLHCQIKATDVDNTMRIERFIPGVGWDNTTTKEVKIDITYGTNIPAVEPNIIMKSGTGSITRVAEIIGQDDPITNAKPTKLIFRLKKVGSPTGTLSAAITESNGTVITSFGTKDVATTLTTETADVVFTNLSNNTIILPGRMATLFWSPSSSGEVHVMSNKGNTEGGNNHHRDVSFLRTYSGTTWTDHLAFDLSGRITILGNAYTGYIELNHLRHRTGIKVDTINSSLIGDKITKVMVGMKIVGSPPLANVFCNIRDSSNFVRASLGFVPVESISSSGTTVVFSNVYNNYALQQNDTVSIEYNVGNADNHVQVRTNLDVFESINTTLFESLAATVGIATPVANRDLAAELYTGGKNFASHIKFLPNVTRVAEKVVTNISSIVNRKVTNIIGRFKRIGTPTGNIGCYIRDASDAIKVSFPEIDVSTIDTANYSNVSFINNVHNYTLVAGDKISFEYSDAEAFNHIQMSVNEDYIDGQNTIGQMFDGTQYTDLGHVDLAIRVHIGGEPDVNSRNRIAQYISHNNSLLKGKKISRVSAYLYKTTMDTNGTIYCNIRRGTDDQLITTLGTFSASALTTDPEFPSYISFVNTSNQYPLSITDKVTIEFSGGNALDSVGVMVRSTTSPNYDSENSYIRMYNGVDYGDIDTTLDLCAKMEEGGFLFIPEEGEVPDSTPVNDKDLIIMGGNNKKSGFFDAFLSEFRLYTKLLSTEQITNLHRNRFTITDLESNEVLMPINFRPSNS